LHLKTSTGEPQTGDRFTANEFAKVSKKSVQRNQNYKNRGVSMKTFLTALAVALVAIFAATGCNDQGNTFQNNTGAQITGLSPSNITAGSPAFTLTLNGVGFVTQTYISWNGKKLTTTDVLDANGDVLQVQAVISADLVAKPGQGAILTHNPFSGSGNNGLSNPVNFIVNPATPPVPVPLLQTLSPTNVTLSTSQKDIPLTLTGSNFAFNNGTLAATVCWNFGTTPVPSPAPAPSAVCGASATALSVMPGTTPTSMQIIATVPAQLLASAGAASVLIINTPTAGVNPPDGGTSTPLAFNIVTPNPVPTLTSIGPTSVSAGSASFPLTVNGTNFVTGTPAAAVVWTAGGMSTTLAVVSSSTPSATQIMVTVPANLIAAAGTANVTVVNPPNIAATPPGGGGGVSGPVAFTINAAAGTGISKSQAAAEETPAVSADGRYVAYTAVQGQHSDVFFRDTCEGAAAECQAKTSLLSVGSDGNGANDDSHTPSMSADGRYVAFSSLATNLVTATTGASSSATAATSGRQIYLRDTCMGAAAGCQPSTELISTDTTGQLAGTESILPSVSASGRFVAFVAVAQSKVPTGNALPASAASTANSTTPNSGYRQIFVRDTCLGVANCTAKTSRISLQPGDGSETAPSANTAPTGPALSGDAKKVALSGSGTAILFTRSIAVDDRVFVAALGEPK
jgi:WD40-like Beta Propeller Repeat